MSHHAGHTLIELMMALLVMAILGSLALPSLRPLLQRWRVQQACSALQHSAYYARHMAISSGRNTWLCPSLDQQHCQAMTQWQGGWLVMRSEPAGHPPTVLRAQAPLDGLSIRSSQGRRRLRFQPDGQAAGSNLTWRICSLQSPRQHALVVVARSGRVRVEPHPAQPACSP